MGLAVKAVDKIQSFHSINIPSEWESTGTLIGGMQALGRFHSINIPSEWE